MPSVTATFGATVEQSCGSDTIGAYKLPNGKYAALYTEVEIDGEAPVVNGYRFVATVDLRGEAPIVRKQPFLENEVDLTKYHDTDSTCEHCNHNRKRNDVLVLQNVDTGETMQIGRNCANDFFGTKDASQRLSVSDWIDAYGSGEGENMPRGEQSVPLNRIFEIAAAVVRKFGWVHAKDLYADNTLTSTKSRVWDNLFPWDDMKAEDKVTITQEDKDETKLVLAWLDEKFLKVDPAKSNDFQRNVQAAVEGQDSIPYVRNRNLNYLIWGIAGYKRDLQKDAEKRRIAAEKAKKVETSEYVGTVNSREEFTLTLTFKRAFGSHFGVKYLQNFEDENGNVIVWWGTNAVAENTAIGETYKFLATIKGHAEYNGIKQTTITRAKLIEKVGG